MSVDELVREGDAPKPEIPPLEISPAAEPETKIVPMEQRRLAWTQVLGVALLVLGLLSTIWGVWTSYAIWAMLSSVVVVLSLPFLLSRKHPFLFAGWVAVVLSCLFLNPRTSVVPWGLRGGVNALLVWLGRPEVWDPALGLGAAIAIVRGSLALVLVFFTARLCCRAWKNRKQRKLETCG